MKSWMMAVLVVMGLTGCATDRAIERRLGELDRCGVTGPVRVKVAELEPLTAKDIITLSRDKVSDGTIVGHVRDAGTVYVLRTAQVEQLRKAGVSAEVVDYLMATPLLEARRRQQALEFRMWAGTSPWYYGPAYRYGYGGYGYGAYGYRCAPYPHGHGHRHR
jgi:hypothetical protein